MINLLRTILVLLAVTAAVAPARAATEDARAFIDTMGREALSVLKSDKSLAQREAEVELLLRRGIDFTAVGRFVLGRYWNRATPQQQEEFLKLFSELVVHRYANLWASSTVEGFTITSVRELDDKDILVQTLVERPNAPPYNFAWRVRGQGDAQKIIDVMVDGVSMVVTQRADFASVVQRQGMDGLIASLRQRASSQ